MQFPTLSFCITCKNRFYQISKTLKKNLDDNRIHAEWIEFVLVDFGSTDGLKEWVLSNFQKELEQGYLRYYYSNKLKYWHMAIAKNTAHFLAKNEIVVNLDCDNYTGFLGGQFVMRQFISNPEILLHQYKGIFRDGSCGRIALMKDYFIKLGGYDESLEPFHYEDIDLLIRVRKLGFNYQNKAFEKYTQVIRNTKEESLVNLNTSYSYDEMLKINETRSREKLNKGYLLANNGSFGIREGLIDHKGKLFSTSQLEYNP